MCRVTELTSMARWLDAIARAFNRLDRRPAVFDRRIRTSVGLWTAPESVPVAQIVDTFAAHGGFTVDGHHVYLPLHEPEAADLTGEYLVYRSNQPVPSITYYDYATDGVEPIALEEFGDTYPAWRLRFWHPAFEPPAPPSFLDGPIDSSAGVGASESDSAAGDKQAPAPTGNDGEPTSVTDQPPADNAETRPGAAETEGSGAATRPSGPLEGPLTIDDDSPVEALRAAVQRRREADREAGRAAFERLDIEQFAERAGAIPRCLPAGLDVDAYGQQTVHLRLAPEEARRGSPDGGRTVGAAGDTGGGEPADLGEQFGIHPGMEVLIDADGDVAGFPVEGEVLDVEGHGLNLTVYWTRSEGQGRPETAFESDSGTQFLVGELMDPVPTERQLDAIDWVAGDDRKAALLTGERNPAYRPEAPVSVPEAGLNADQYRAARRALAAEDVHCIHGPPATGTTRTLVRIVRAAAEAGLRVLACADSPRAVDELLVGGSTPERADPRSLHGLAEAGTLTVARSGVAASDGLVHSYDDESVWSADVVCTTTDGAHRFGQDAFDLAVVDEAAQATASSTLIPWATAERIVLAGDHRQLPPGFKTEADQTEEIEVSLFEHVLARDGEDVVTPLRTQYRMNTTIAAFSNATFYGGVLNSGDRNRDWTIGSLEPLVGIHVDGDERKTPAGSYRNEVEAKAVGRQVSQLLHAGINPGEIGVVVAHAGQIGAIRERLLDLHDHAVAEEVDVGTVDEFQGTERAAIVGSFVRSNAQGDTGYLTVPRVGPRWLNTALTRAKRRCVLVGNFETLGTIPPHRSPDASCAELYQNLRSHLREAGHLEEPDW